MKMRIPTLFFTILGLAIAGHAAAGDLTAFELMKAGNRYVGFESKDKVLQIHSEKSEGSLTPNVWRVVYYDPSAGSKMVEVKFEGGKEMDVSHPARPFLMSAHEHDVLNKSMLNVDSDKALRIVKSQPLLKNLKLKASQLTLDHSKEGPVWKIQLWAAKLNNPYKEADIGIIVLSANDGSVVKSDLHPNRVD
jgi:hypothetical protein